MNEQNINQNTEEDLFVQQVQNVSELSEFGSAPAPHEKQLLYWKKDLHYKWISLLISISGFFLIIFGIAANYWQITINTEQLRINTAQSERVQKSIRANVQNSVLNHVITLDKLFMEKPYLVPYFYENKSIDNKDDKYQEAVSAAEMMLDIMDVISAQNKTFPEFWDDPQAWDEWMIDIFSTSPVLRDTLDKRLNWYSGFLLDLRKKGQDRLEKKNSQNARQTS